MRTILLLLLVALAAVAAIPFIPLGTAVDLLQLRRVGFEAAHAEGNLWRGQLYEARLAKVELGDVSTRLSLDDIGSGRIRLDLEGSDEVSRLKGVFSYGLGGAGIEDFSIGLPVMAGPPPIGGVTVIVDGLRARFPGGQCTDGGGSVRAYLSGALPALGLPGEMSGPALCRDGKLAFDMMSESGREQEVITILSPTRYLVRLFVRPQSTRTEQFLRARGFQPAEGGYVYEEERTI